MQTPTAPLAEPTRSPAAKDALQAIVTVLGLGGVILTGIQYWAVDRYLAQFGVTPEEIGLDTSVLLTRAATALVFLGLLIVPALLALPSLFSMGMTEGSDRRRLAAFLSRQLRQRPGLRTLALSALVGVAWAAASLAESPIIMLREGLWVTMLAAGTLMAAPALHLAGKHKTLGPLLRLCVIAFMMTGLCLMSLGDVMEKRGMRTAESANLGWLEQLLGIRAQYVRADFSEVAGSPTPEDGPMLHLGQASGIHVLYDCSSSTVIRKAAVQVQLTTYIGRSRDLLAHEVEDSCRP
ncbi:hypothetical protein OG730_19690 [Streptomyces sp. NBC_01298]|uniref:hypothetical protein n=1 Tax=Streptomyces sp. NBC_01298 TaxID=2903817 RepID=UPI002E10333D|nr:hypothetical protein OG730_19690 [Streptomyces sp. NBC_01298]